MAIEIEDPSLFDNFPPFNASDLPSYNFDDETNLSDLDLDNIDVDFSIDDIDLYLNDSPLDSADSNSNSISPSPNSNLTTNSPNSNINSNPQSPESNSSSSSKRKIEDVDDTHIENSNTNLNEEEKRKIRLMRNRESAQLSRQRKKQYIEELEQKVKALNATVADLNGKVSYYMAENVRLHNLVNGNSGGNGNNNLVHAPPPPMPFPYPWIPYYGYPMKPSYVPIPRMKSVKVEESKKTERKRKKLASVSFLGLFLLAMLVMGGMMNFRFGESESGVDDGKIFDVKGPGRSYKNSSDINKMEFGNMSQMYSEVMSGLGDKYNSSESLPALLYVPRNGKHVEINGNLIIQSVLASERAVANVSSGSNGRETSLAIAMPRGSTFAVSSSRDPRACGKLNEHTKALPSDSHGANGDNAKSPLADKSLQQWFLEGLAGPILSSGTCTEVFQFDVSPSAVNPGGIVPSAAAAALNITDKTHESSNIRSRRMGQLIPLNGTAYNNKTQQFDKPVKSNNSLNGNSSSSSMVVSVLVDPREAGDVDCDGMITPKSISRIFVVVLVDSVKYITYSCMLPFKSHVPHLVN